MKTAAQFLVALPMAAMVFVGLLVWLGVWLVAGVVVTVIFGGPGDECPENKNMETHEHGIG